MAVGYVADLEARPTHPTTDAVVRLAAALETTPDTLLGGDVDQRPAPARPATGPVFDALTRETAMELLATKQVGRLAFHSPDRGPVALPINYRLMDGDIVLRTASDSSLATAAGQDPVGFEVDSTDEATGQGWSVLVTGRVDQVDDPAEQRRLLEHSATPWVGDDRNRVLRLLVGDVSGRRVGARP